MPTTVPPPPPAPAAPKSFTVDNRWTPDLVADGFTPVSVYFLENYNRLNPPITHSEAMLVIHLVRYKWSAEAPYPGFRALADQMGISPQMARAHARSLEEKGYLLREMQTGTTNRFHLKPLFDALTQHRARAQAKAQPTPPLPAIPQPTSIPAAQVRARIRTRSKKATGESSK